MIKFIAELKQMFKDLKGQEFYKKEIYLAELRLKEIYGRKAK